ncbi:MAG: hypothetical protein ABJA02_09535 [Acidobacteriota bacterium]
MKLCSWKDCSRTATLHARFGYRILGSRDVPAPSESYTILHRSLCDEHIENIKDSYLDVTVYPIGSCPSCDGATAAQRGPANGL